MRLFIAMRSRLAQDELTTAVRQGVKTLVVLGAGLDTSGYRLWPDGLQRVYEVDHPATQAWKRQRLSDAGIATPEGLMFVPVDFESQTLAERLAAAGFEYSEPVFFSWLGVVSYLSEEAVWSTLRFVSRSCSGSQIVFDYGETQEALDEQDRKERRERERRVAALGEAWITFFEPADLRARLQDIGFGKVEDFGSAALVKRFFPDLPVPERRGTGHVLRAVVA